MRPHRVAVAEDDDAARSEITRRIAAQPDFVLVGEAAGVAAAVTLVRRHRPDLLFLDALLPDPDGSAGPGRVTSGDWPRVVLITPRDVTTGAISGLDVLDFLLEPFDAGQLDACLERVRRRLRRVGVGGTDERRPPGPGWPAAPPGPRRHLERFLVRLPGGRTLVVPVDRVLWLEADRNYVLLHTAEATHRIRASLGEVARRLDPRRFARVHRSAVVNLERVVEFKPTASGDFELLVGGRRLRMSRGHRAEFERRMRGLS